MNHQVESSGDIIPETQESNGNEEFEEISIERTIDGTLLQNIDIPVTSECIIENSFPEIKDIRNVTQRTKLTQVMHTVENKKINFSSQANNSSFVEMQEENKASCELPTSYVIEESQVDSQDSNISFDVSEKFLSLNDCSQSNTDTSKANELSCPLKLEESKEEPKTVNDSSAHLSLISSGKINDADSLQDKQSTDVLSFKDCMPSHEFRQTHPPEMCQTFNIPLNFSTMSKVDKDKELSRIWKILTVQSNSLALSRREANAPVTWTRVCVARAKPQPPRSEIYSLRRRRNINILQDNDIEEELPEIKDITTNNVEDEWIPSNKGRKRKCKANSKISRNQPRNNPIKSVLSQVSQIDTTSDDDFDIFVKSKPRNFFKNKEAKVTSSNSTNNSPVIPQKTMLTPFDKLVIGHNEIKTVPAVPVTDVEKTSEQQDDEIQMIASVNHTSNSSNIVSSTPKRNCVIQDKKQHNTVQQENTQHNSSYRIKNSSIQRCTDVPMVAPSHVSPATQRNIPFNQISRNVSSDTRNSELVQIKPGPSRLQQQSKLKF